MWRGAEHRCLLLLRERPPDRGRAMRPRGLAARCARTSAAFDAQLFVITRTMRERSGLLRASPPSSRRGQPCPAGTSGDRESRPHVLSDGHGAQRRGEANRDAAPRA